MSSNTPFDPQDWRRFLSSIGEDPSRPGLHETPARVHKAWQEWTAGYAQDPGAILKVFSRTAPRPTAS